MLNIIKNTINRVFASGVDSDASAFITATGLSGTTQKSAITTLVKDLKSSGLWSKMKAVYPMVTDNYNLLSYTEDFSNAAWGKVEVTIATNVTTAPNGTNTADSVTETTNTNAHLVHNSAPLSIPTGNLTSSIYVKKGNRNWFYLNLYNGTTSAICWFNINTGVIGTTQSGITASIQDIGNGWFRLSGTRNMTTTNNAYVQYGAADADNSTNYVGNGLIAAYIWGAQYEFNSTASTYQPILTTPSAFMASQMKYNLKDARDLDAAFRLTWSGGWTYSATGATPNGTNAYADTKLVPSTAIASVNSNSLGYYSGSNLAEISSDPVNMGAFISVTQASTILKSNTQIASRVNGDLLSYATATMRGFFYSTRPSASVANLFFNGTKVNTITPNGTLPNCSISLGTVNIANVPYTLGYVKNDFRFASIGDGLSDAEAALLYSLVQQFQTDLTRQV
jgi:hypothetical protein